MGGSTALVVDGFALAGCLSCFGPLQSDRLIGPLSDLLNLDHYHLSHSKYIYILHLHLPIAIAYADAHGKTGALFN